MSPPIEATIRAHPKMSGGAPTAKIRDYVRLLLGLREPNYDFERELRLFQMQSCVYFAGYKLSGIVTAGRMAAILFLAKLENQHTLPYKIKKGSSGHLQELFKLAPYRAIFNSLIARSGGWSGLSDLEYINNFYKEIEDGFKQANIAALTVDYMFRLTLTNVTKTYLLSQNNISHAHVYTFNMLKNKKNVRAKGSTIRKAWGNLRSLAVFLYVSEFGDYKFCPPETTSENFIEELSAQVNDQSHLTAFIGKCAFVYDAIKIDKYRFLCDCFPPSAELPRICFPAAPLELSNERILELENYKNDYDEYQNS